MRRRPGSSVVVILVGGALAAACAEPKGDPPEVARITPDAACGDGVVTLLLEGNHFDPDAAIDFPVANTNAGIHIEQDQRGVLSERRAVVLFDQTQGAPAQGAPPIVHDVRVTNPDGQEGRLLGGFKTYAPFTLTSLEPDRGPAGTTVAMVLHGTGFYGLMSLQIGAAAAVTVDGIQPASALNANVALEIPVSARPGSYAVILRNAGGCEIALDRAFMVE
ncbi:MAG TPA: hypothetical protein VHE35_29305 [Kofleriaceae bacterium]|nr:hypothetical protein [Kofleriaceae bacterium]